jgi:hypothetical protein
MALGHALVRSIVTVARIHRDVVRPHDSRASECRLEYIRRPRHRKLGEVFARDTGDRIQRVRFSGLLDNVVEERPKAGAGQVDSCVDDDLHNLLEIELGGDARGGLVERLQQPLLVSERGRCSLQFAYVGIDPEPAGDLTAFVT